MSAAPDFRLYRSNALDVLAGLLAEALRAPAPGCSLLEPDTILIPQAAMRRWLQATLAARHGIAANLEFLTPGEFVVRALDANLGASDDDLDADSLHWRLYAALRDPMLPAKPAMAQLAAYMAGEDPLKPWALAGELAGVFEKYQAWRRDWLLRWESGADPGDPQAILWRAVAAGRAHRARRIHRYLARFADGGSRPAGLPSRLFAFAIVNISPDVLRVIASQARAGTLHFYLPTPTTGDWGDLEVRGADRATAAENPLLRDWGAAGRDFMALLGSYEAVHPALDIDAGVDPEAAGGGVPERLLARLQADLFHRRAAPSGHKRGAVDAGDPSLQFHACHTRLRELQVLHDRLRALLEDPRFEPPLQPREIAVLAPDIDHYVPYLDAVFGGGQGDRASGDAIAFAVADASPLASEPLAGVFLRLLALPVARFGLEELLDLLASPPVAEAAGLEAADFERLHGWLHATGARWGIDAAHRARLGAPADDAYTWQFALDRLLLGHASGSEDVIGGIAPWPDLEGGALDTLDALLRLLGELARYQRVLGVATTPAAWRERLLGLLDALVPRPPALADGQRALDRLRTLIDAFARQADKAGFGTPVPVEVVRAHFTARLTEADTRAPLLTGGVSFARMVPMRLLPFRVICLLGMNDGDFPRRDPAAGLNRLTAELGTAARRLGDRSTRDDDRYLFLQLFTAAQDVFYLSWLGMDARDGSTREPSALVTELLAAAAEHHAHPRQAARDLQLRHPLQPFSPAAFGTPDAAADADPRSFSYRGHWHPAAGCLSSGTRQPLPPWMDVASALAAPAEPETDLSLDALRHFLMAPAEQFLRQRLGLRLTEVEAAGEDIEPLQSPRPGLQRTLLQRAVFDGLLAGQDTAARHASLRARGLLPSGPLGERVLLDIEAEVAPYARAYADWRAGADGASLPLEVEVDGVRLHGRLADVFPKGIARLQFGKPGGRAVIRNGLDWLLARAAGEDLQFFEFHESEQGIGPHPRQTITRDAAIDALRALLALRREGLRRPLPFAPYSGWALFDKRNDVAGGLKNAMEKWRGRDHGRDHGWAEGDTAALRLALRARDPFADAAFAREFARIAGIVFGAAVQGAATPIAITAAALPEDDGAEEDA